MERHQRQLERGTGHDHQHSNHKDRTKITGCLKGCGYLVKTEGADVGVHQCDTEQGDAAGQCRQNEILDAGFQGELGDSTGMHRISDHGVQAYPQHFHAKQERYEMVAAGENDRSEGGGHQKDVELLVLDVMGLEIRVCQERYRYSADNDQVAEEQAVFVDH